MINLSPIAEFMSIALHCMAWTLILCGVLVWTQRQENKKQRIYLAFMLLFCGVMMMCRVLLTYSDGVPDMYPALPMLNLYGGFCALLLLFLYPVEVVNPGWLRWRTLLFLFTPLILILLILTLFPMEFRTLNGWKDIITHIGEPNVWFRILMLAVFIIPYSILLLCVPYNWRRSTVNAKWIYAYVIGTQVIGLLYILFMLTGSLVVTSIHLVYFTMFMTYITYQELFIRLFPDANKVSIEQHDPTPPKAKAGVTAPVPDLLPPSSVWERFVFYMESESPWLSPNIALGDVAEVIGCSRSSLSAAISAREGGETFHSLVAHYRIRQFCEMVEHGEVDEVNEALFSVGFRSRSTAYERFKEQMGITPAEYIKTIRKNQ